MTRKLTVAVACMMVMALVCAAGAGAREVVKYQYAGSFDGSTSTAGAFTNVAHLAVDQVSGEIYVVDIGRTAFSRFDATGAAVPFSNPPLPGSSIAVQDLGENPSCCKRSYIAVDNSDGPNQGRIYLLSHGNSGILKEPEVLSFLPSGQEQSGNWPLCGSRCAKPHEFDAEPRGIGVDDEGRIWVATPLSGFLTPVPGEMVAMTPDGVRIDETAITVDGSPRVFDFDAEGNIYVASPPPNVGDIVTRKIVPDPSIELGAEFNVQFFSRAVGPGAGSDNGIVVDRSRDLVYVNQADRVDVYDTEGNQVGELGRSEGPYAGLITESVGVAVHEASGRVYVANASTQEVDIFESLPAVTVPDVGTGGTTGVTATQATIQGTVNPDGGGDTNVCRFEWGLTAKLENSTPCAQGQVHPSAGGEVQVSAQVTGLLKGRQYFYRVAGGNESGPIQQGKIEAFWAAEKPVVADPEVTDVSTSTADVQALIDPEGGNTSYWVEVGETPAYGMVFPVSFANFYEEYKACHFRWFSYKIPACIGRLRWSTGYQAMEEAVQAATAHLSGLEPNTVYHYRVVAENDAGTDAGPDQTFETFDFKPTLVDACDNKLARQQTSGAHLLDCRAYELVSAGDAAGYDVRSDLAPGEAPLAGYPDAHGKALYALLDGGIPGTGNPTNRGPDPYVATRDATNERWDTAYVGVPSFAPSTGPFASRLADADRSLTSFAFGGSDFCSPCFDDGDTNIPVRLADGNLRKGMLGSLDPGNSEPAGDVRKHFSADGTHFVFGSTAQFEPEGHGNGTDVTIYDRNLQTGVTQVVSTEPNGDTIAVGADLAVLDMSEDGSRIVVGKRISTDASGNDHVHPYMHVGSSSGSIDLAPGTTTGVVYNGMTADGSRVYFSSSDQLTGDDTDTSGDVFVAEPNGTTADVTRVSVGSAGAGNTDACAPEPNSVNPSWNSTDGGSDCDAVPVGGGGSIAADKGSIYFLTPEKLDGASGVVDAPNLYYAEPGEAPRFVATLESRHSGPAPLATSHPFSHHFGELSNPQSIAAHVGSGSVYVLEFGTSSVRKFDADGGPSNFTATGNNSLGGLALFAGFSQLAVDNSGGATDGNIYVTNTFAGIVSAFNSEGAPIGALTGATAPGGYGGFTTGVAVAPNGDVYVGGLGARIHRYIPTGPSVTDADYASTLVLSVAPSGLAADSAGAVYTHTTSGIGGVTKYDASQFGLPTSSGAVFDADSKGAYVDPETDHVYISHGDELVERLPSGAPHGTFGSGDVVNSLGVAFNPGNGRVYASDATEGRVGVFTTELGSDPKIDSPVVVNAVNDAEIRHTSDFDTGPDGGVGVFPSTIALTGYPTKRTAQLYRVDANADTLVCVSCASTGKPSTGDAGLAANGASIADDGRVFFNSPDRLVLGDGNGQQDVYEWSEEAAPGGRAELISTGVSEAASSLLSVTADGTDAFFFTRQKLVAQDLNGPTVKLYTARENGGFFALPKSQGCKASDECRGAGTTPAAPASIGSVTGSSGQVPVTKRKRCKKGQVKRRGKCVRKKRNKRNRGKKRRGKGKNKGKGKKPSSNNRRGRSR